MDIFLSLEMRFAVFIPAKGVDGQTVDLTQYFINFHEVLYFVDCSFFNFDALIPAGIYRQELLISTYKEDSNSIRIFEDVLFIFKRQSNKQGQTILK